MRMRKLVVHLTLGTFIAALGTGCSDADVQGVKVAPEKPAPPEESKPVPKEVTKGGGPSSSGNLRRNPGADPLKPNG